MRTLIGLAALALSSTAAFADTWVRCAPEGGTCRFEGTREVRYGTTTRSVTRSFVNSAPCQRESFDEDPAKGWDKFCSYKVIATKTTVNPSPPGWTMCAIEGAVCNFKGARRVVFGSERTWVWETFTDGVRCSPAVFGDPAPGKRKECRYSLK